MGTGPCSNLARNVVHSLDAEGQGSHEGRGIIDGLVEEARGAIGVQLRVIALEELAPHLGMRCKHPVEVHRRPSTRIAAVASAVACAFGAPHARAVRIAPLGQPRTHASPGCAARETARRRVGHVTPTVVRASVIVKGAEETIVSGVQQNARQAIRVDGDLSRGIRQHEGVHDRRGDAIELPRVRKPVRGRRYPRQVSIGGDRRFVVERVHKDTSSTQVSRWVAAAEASVEVLNDVATSTRARRHDRGWSWERE